MYGDCVRLHGMKFGREGRINELDRMAAE